MHELGKTPSAKDAAWGRRIRAPSSPRTTSRTGSCLGHALFDAGYVTVTPSLELGVSRRTRDEFESRRDYTLSRLIRSGLSGSGASRLGALVCCDEEYLWA